tara:strand:- start:110 stop:694 length:585 start_codon:yes stop_codon:yes gene_type:complete
MDFLLDLDQSLFIFLNSLGSVTFDSFWLFISESSVIEAIYLALVIEFLWFFKIKDLKSILIFLLSLILMIVFTDQSSNFFKEFFERLRPCHNPELIEIIRIVKNGCGGLYGFFSAHAANTFAFATFMYFLTPNEQKYKRTSFFLFIWAAIISYSRIYIGVHFPLDIFLGAVYGFLSGYFFHKPFLYFKKSKLLL